MHFDTHLVRADIAEIGENQYIHYLGLFAFIVSIFVSRRYFGRLTSTHAKKQVCDICAQQGAVTKRC